MWTNTSPPGILFKDYWTRKKVLLNYNKNGRSVGVATIIFSQAQSAAEAAKKLDSVKVDGKPMRVSLCWTGS